MSAPTAGEPRAHLPRPHWRAQSEIRVALVAAACLLVEAVVAKNVVDVHLDWWSQLAAMWVWLVYMLGGRRDRVAELAFMAVAILATAAILVLYAV